MVPEAENSIALFFQPGTPSRVRFASTVLAAIDLNDEPELLADEIGDERAKRLLPSKFAA